MLFLHTTFKRVEQKSYPYDSERRSIFQIVFTSFYFSNQIKLNRRRYVCSCMVTSQVLSMICDTAFKRDELTRMEIFVATMH